MTIRPGPTIASSVFRRADTDVRAPTSSVEMVPKAPLMSATCAESSAAPRAGAARALLVVVMAEHPFRRRKTSGIRGHAEGAARRGSGGLLQSGLSRWRPARVLRGGACACPVRAEGTASGAGHGPVYRVSRLASLQPRAPPHPAP